MAEGRDRAEWHKLSHILAFIRAHGGDRSATPEKFTPYRRPRKPKGSCSANDLIAAFVGPKHYDRVRNQNGAAHNP